MAVDEEMRQEIVEVLQELQAFVLEVDYMTPEVIVPAREQALHHVRVLLKKLQDSD